MLKLLKAFTLAEILIVMSVIGVVSGLTVPKLKDNFDVKTRVAQTRKVASDLQTAYDAAVLRYGSPQGWYGTASSLYTSDFTSKYFESLALQKDCGTSAGCMVGLTYDSNTNYYKALLKNGAAIGVRITQTSADCNGTAYSNVYYHCPMGEMYVDVNGSDMPNTIGYDLFRFVISQSGVEPDGLSQNDGVLLTSNAVNATAWVIKAGNQDYLSCLSSLSWATKRSCK